MLAAEEGHTETIKLLLTAPGINVNHANVSLFPLTPSHLVGGGMRVIYLTLSLTLSNPRNDDLSSLIALYVP